MENLLYKASKCELFFVITFDSEPILKANGAIICSAYIAINMMKAEDQWRLFPGKTHFYGTQQKNHNPI